MSTRKNSASGVVQEESSMGQGEMTDGRSTEMVEHGAGKDHEPLIIEGAETVGSGREDAGDDDMPKEEASPDIENGNALDQDDSPLLEDGKEQSGKTSVTTKVVIEDEIGTMKFSEDIYSLLYTVEVKSLAFLFAFATFLMQITILILIFVDLVDMTNDPPRSPNGETNRLKIPAGTETYVTVAQFFGVALTINFMAHGGDLLKGLRTLLNGYQEEILDVKPGATKLKWFLSGTFQAFAGALMTLDLFILMMQSTNVIGMCLNFAALYFVQDIDDVGFAVASLGLVSRRIQQECLSLGDIAIPVQAPKRRLLLTRAFMTCVWIGFYAWFCVIIYRQTNGQFRCTALYVQFGDKDFPEMPYYSGRFAVKYGAGNLPYQFNDRAVFWDGSDTIRIRYSKGEQAWVIERSLERDDPQYEGYMFKSSQTATFDIAEVADQTWFAYKEGGDVPVDWLYMNCANCRTDRCISDYGRCENDICVCNFGRVGQHCEGEYSECQHLGLDLRTSSEVRNMPGANFFTQNEFQDLNKLSQEKLRFRFTFYDRDIYIPYSFGVDAEQEKVVNWIAFTGRRWIIYGTDAFRENQLNQTAFREFLRITQFSNATARKEGLRSIARSSGYVPIFFSSPVDYGTPSFGYDPTSVTWFFSAPFEPNNRGPEPIFFLGPQDDAPVPAKLLCSDCSGSKSCGSGICNEDWGYCMCEPFYAGYQCEYVYSCLELGCFNGGTCNAFTGGCEHCLPDASGTLCQYPLAPKIEENLFFCNITNGLLGPCQNGQKCNGIEQKCECEEPFYGEHCELATQANCSAVGPIWGSKGRPGIDPCQNGGYCDWYLDYPICRCREPWEGDFCEFDPTVNATLAANATLNVTG